MNYVYQNYVPRVTSTLASWFSQAASAFQRKTRRTVKKNKLLVTEQPTARYYSPGPLADFPLQRAISSPGTVGLPYRRSVLNPYAHTQYKLASYRRLHTRFSSTVHVVPNT